MLRARGVALLGPGEGDQACGEVGAGRMLEPLQIVAALRALAPRRRAGRRAACWSAPARPARTSTRCASWATAAPARWVSRSPRQPRAMGAQVTLVAGPVALATPPGVRRIDVRRARADARRRARPRCPARTSTSAPPRSPTTCRPQTQRRRRSRRPPTTLHAGAGAHARHPGRGRRARRSGRAAWSASPPRPSDVERYARGKLQRQEPRPDRRQRRRPRRPAASTASDNALTVYSARRRARDIPRGRKARGGARALLDARRRPTGAARMKPRGRAARSSTRAWAANSRCPTTPPRASAGMDLRALLRRAADAGAGRGAAGPDRHRHPHRRSRRCAR